MGGERTTLSKQPGGREPAPEPLALVQAFVNTHFDLEVEHGAELLATPAAVGAWFVRAGLLADGAPVSTAEHRRALSAREGLRTLAAGNGAELPTRARAVALAAIDEAARGAAVELRFAAGPPGFVPASGSGVAGGLGVLLTIVAGAIEDGRWGRLKVCPGTDCGWAFYDHSRNQTGRWCSMSVCGGRAKARSHYRRRRAQ